MRLALLVAVVIASLSTVAATAAEITAGWALTDVGLDRDRGGPVVGLGARTVLAPARADLVYGLEYIQKRGAQPTWFSDPVDAFIRDDARVTLHVLQPVALVELTAGPAALPRPYAGLSVALKISERWAPFPGTPSSQWGYKDTDFVAHFGLTREAGPLRLDVRYSAGLTGQLIVDPEAGAPVKAQDPLPGVSAPEEGARLSQWQVAVGVAF